MKRNRFIEAQIIFVLREYEAELRTGDDLTRRHRVSETTNYNWKAKFCDVDLPDPKQLRALEDILLLVTMAT